MPGTVLGPMGEILGRGGALGMGRASASHSIKGLVQKPFLRDVLRAGMRRNVG